MWKAAVSIPETYRTGLGASNIAFKADYVTCNSQATVSKVCLLFLPFRLAKIWHDVKEMGLFVLQR
jgi:hypothetical protein